MKSPPKKDLSKSPQLPTKSQSEPNDEENERSLFATLLKNSSMNQKDDDEIFVSPNHPQAFF